MLDALKMGGGLVDEYGAVECGADPSLVSIMGEGDDETELSANSDSMTEISSASASCRVSIGVASASASKSAWPDRH
jgi:hypothetical protein